MNVAMSGSFGDGNKSGSSCSCVVVGWEDIAGLVSLDTVIVAMRDQPLSPGDQRPRVPAVLTRSSIFGRQGLGSALAKAIDSKQLWHRKAALKVIEIALKGSRWRKKPRPIMVGVLIKWARNREMDQGLRFEAVDMPLAAHVVVTLV